MSFSYHPNPATKTTPMHKGTRTGAEPHEYVAPPHVRARIRSPKPNKKRSWPPASIVTRRLENRARLLLVSAALSVRGIGWGPRSSLRRSTKTMMIAARQIGRLMAKHHLQFALVRYPVAQG